LRVAQVTEILRQKGDYKQVAQALSEGRPMRQSRSLISSAGSNRFRMLSVTSNWRRLSFRAAELKKDGKPKSALVVSPARGSSPHYAGDSCGPEDAGQARR